MSPHSHFSKPVSAKKAMQFSIISSAAAFECSEDAETEPSDEAEGTEGLLSGTPLAVLPGAGAHAASSRASKRQLTSGFFIWQHLHFFRSARAFRQPCKTAFFHYNRPAAHWGSLTPCGHESIFCGLSASGHGQGKLLCHCTAGRPGGKQREKLL